LVRQYEQTSCAFANDVFEAGYAIRVFRTPHSEKPPVARNYAAPRLLVGKDYNRLKVLTFGQSKGVVMAIETNRVIYEGDPTAKGSVGKSSALGSEHIEQTDYEKAHKIAAGGVGLAALLGLVTVVLSILGLVNIAPFWMAGISAIALGVALLLSGGFSMEWFTTPREHFFFEGENAMSTDVLVGFSGIVLGILSLMGIVPEVLLPVSVLAFGVSMFISSWLSASHFSGIKCLTGLTGIVLGILALMNYPVLALTLSGLLVLGFGVLFSGSIMSGKYMYAANAA
jgi:hypothetical protein